MPLFQLTITASLGPLNIGSVTVNNAEMYNGLIPGPQINVNVGDDVAIRFINDLPYASGIHWHGIELNSYSDGTEVTQNEVPGAPLQILGNGVPAGGTFLYKFKAVKRGIFWYHPHHGHSTNRVFHGLYGMIVVTDPDETSLVGNVLPSAANSFSLVLSDTTICKAVTTNDTTTFPATSFPSPIEWLGNSSAQPTPSPATLCELSPLDDDGMAAMNPFNANDIPNIHNMNAGPSSEGQTVLVNGKTVAARGGTPAVPSTFTGLPNITVVPGSGLRFRIVNCAASRFFRLILTTSAGVQIPLIRVGGEGGVLNTAVLEGGTTSSGFNTGYFPGEILLPPGTRADVVAAIPTSVTGVCTIWTRDYQRIGNNPFWANIPTVPVYHINVSGTALSTPYTISGTTALMSTTSSPTVAIGTAPDLFLDPSLFIPAKPGMSLQQIILTATPGTNGINSVQGMFDGFFPYTTVPKIGSTRWAKKNDVLTITVKNNTPAHHPFHLHGFSFQPISLTPNTSGPPTFTWTYNEFRDNVDIPGNYTLTFKVAITDRTLTDGTTMGGALGRWFFHCHIFFHAHHGMISELVITDPDGSGSEKPNVNVHGSWCYAPLNGIATRTGTYSHPDGDPITLSTPFGTVVNLGGGNWSWSWNVGSTAQTLFGYVTATDSSGRQDQCVFRIKAGAPDDGSDIGDPHIHTVDHKQYDFQAVGEFTLLKDRDGMEVQARQSPVLTASSIFDPYDGLRVCVSLNTAVAAKVGTHTVAYQPMLNNPAQLEFFVDGQLTPLTTQAINLGGHLVTGFLVNGRMAMRIDYLNHSVVIATPMFWTAHNTWYLNISVYRTLADEGVMGAIPPGNWLPLLPSGASLGAMPPNLHDRYITLYKTFADAWRVTDQTSMFVYAPGYSTASYTDRDWPAEDTPCTLRPGFGDPELVAHGMDIDQATMLCDVITDGPLNQDCVFDLTVIGDEEMLEGFIFAQDIRQRGTAVQLVSVNQNEFTAIVAPLINTEDTPVPHGKITFFVDDEQITDPLEVGPDGRVEIGGNGQGEFIRAVFEPTDPTEYYPSSSAYLRIRPE